MFLKVLVFQLAVFVIQVKPLLKNRSFVNTAVTHLMTVAPLVLDLLLQCISKL